MLIKESNKRDINHKPLAENWERVQDFRLEDGSKPEVVALPMPSPVFYKNWRLPASYANFYHQQFVRDRPDVQRPERPRGIGI